MKDTGFSVPRGEARPARDQLPDRSPRPAALELYDEAARRPVEPPARVPVRRRRAGLDRRRLPGLRPDDAEQGHARRRAHPVAALGRADDDRPADARAEGGVRTSSPATGTATAGASACPSSPGATTWRRSPGRFGWDGGLGTSWYSDPREEWSAILMTQRAWTSPSPPDVCLDFWTSAS